jgi:hypothetical protein
VFDVEESIGVDANIHETRKDARKEKDIVSNWIQSALMNGMLSLYNFDISKWSISSAVDKFTDALKLNPEYTEYIKKFNLKDTHTHDNIVNNLDTNKINNLDNLLKKTNSRNIQDKFDKLKVNLVEQAIHSQIVANSDPTSSLISSNAIFCSFFIFIAYSLLHLSSYILDFGLFPSFIIIEFMFMLLISFSRAFRNNVELNFWLNMLFFLDFLFLLVKLDLFPSASEKILSR